MENRENTFRNKYCMFCGAAVGADANFCPDCGKSLKEETAPAQPDGKAEQESGAEPVIGVEPTIGAEPENGAAPWPEDNAAPGGGEAKEPQAAGEKKASSVSGRVLAFVRKRWKLLAAAAIALFALNILLADSDIDGIKHSTLTQYDYGVTIGDALHNWFAGTEEWDAYTDHGSKYVIVSGTCPYALQEGGEPQAFYFRVVDDEHFQFLYALDQYGDYICSSTGSYAGDAYLDVVTDVLGGYIGFDLYETALEAAFGSEEAMKMFR